MGGAPAPSLYGDFGDYSSYSEASALCGEAYEQSNVLDKTLQLTKDIKPNDELLQINIRLLAAVQYVFSRLGNQPVRILDFGGALGSHYFFLRHFLSEQRLKWTVVELPATAEIGNAHLANDELTFANSIDIAGPADLVIASGAIQFMPDPYSALRADPRSC